MRHDERLCMPPLIAVSMLLYDPRTEDSVARAAHALVRLQTLVLERFEPLREIEIPFAVARAILLSAGRPNAVVNGIVLRTIDDADAALTRLIRPSALLSIPDTTGLRPFLTVLEHNIASAPLRILTLAHALVRREETHGRDREFDRIEKMLEELLTSWRLRI